jgi:hypothetical protein
MEAPWVVEAMADFSVTMECSVATESRTSCLATAAFSA